MNANRTLTAALSCRQKLRRKHMHMPCVQLCGVQCLSVCLFTVPELRKYVDLACQKHQNVCILSVANSLGPATYFL